MAKFFNNPLFFVKGRVNPFHHYRDAVDYCEEKGIDKSTIEKYDSRKEYERWLLLLTLEKQGTIHSLRRQVEYEIIPEHKNVVQKGTRKVTTWSVGEHDFGKKSEAEAYCKNFSISRKTIEKRVVEEPRYKEITKEKAAYYTADFVYVDTATGETVVEDVKSEYTRKEKDYILRRKLMLDRHGLEIQEIVL